MKKSQFIEEKIIRILKQHEVGLKTAGICREHGISPAMFYGWKSKYAGMDVSEAGAWLRSNVGAGGAEINYDGQMRLHYALNDGEGTKHVQVETTLNGQGQLVIAEEETCQSLPFGDRLTCTDAASDVSQLSTSPARKETRKPAARAAMCSA